VVVNAWSRHIGLGGSVCCFALHATLGGGAGSWQKVTRRVAREQPLSWSGCV